MRKTKKNKYRHQNCLLALSTKIKHSTVFNSKNILLHISSDDSHNNHYWNQPASVRGERQNSKERKYTTRMCAVLSIEHMVTNAEFLDNIAV